MKKDRSRSRSNFLLKMSSLLVKAIFVLILICLLQRSVSGQTEATVRIRLDEEAGSMFNVLFSEETFRTFYGHMCSGAESCDAMYMTGNNGIVSGVNPGQVQNNAPVMPAYQCRNMKSSSSLNCTSLNETPCLSNKYVKVQSFRLNDDNCQSRCVALAWTHADESVTFNNTNLPDVVEDCYTFSACPSTTPTPEALKSSSTTRSKPLLPLSTSSTSTGDIDKDSNTTVGGKTSNKDSDGDNTGVIVGVVMAVLVVAVVVIIGAVWWRRRKKQGNKEPENIYVNNPASIGLNDTTSPRDSSSGVHSRPTEGSETSPRDRNLASQGSEPQTAHSKLQVQDSNASEHLYYRPVTTNPYCNSNDELGTNSTKQTVSGTLSNTPAYVNVPSSTPNDTPEYIFIPNSTPGGSNEDKTSSGYINQDKNFYVDLVDEPQTGCVYSDADVPYSTVTGDYVNRNVSADPTTEQRASAIYSD